MKEDTEITLTRGLSIAGRLNPAEIPNRPEVADIKALFDALEMTAPVPVFGGAELSGGASAAPAAAAAAGSSTLSRTAARANPRGFLEALLPSILVPGLPEGQVRLANTRLSLANLDGKALRAGTDLSFVPPPSLAGSLTGFSKGKPVTLDSRYNLLGYPGVTATVEVRLVRAGMRAVIVRRRQWT